MKEVSSSPSKSVDIPPAHDERVQELSLQPLARKPQRWPLQGRTRQPQGSPLQVKLVLSFLGVALGAILLLIVVVSVAVQNYFYSAQRDQLRSQAEIIAQQIEERYEQQGESWDNIGPLRLYSPDLFVVIDTNHNLRSAPPSLPLSNTDISLLNAALTQALQGHTVEGNLQGEGNGSNTFSGLYISLPIRSGDSGNGQIIGAMVFAEPHSYPQGFSPYDFLANVDQVILITGAIIALAVVIFSLLLARSLTRPLKSLTAAAEQMKGGNYAQRVVAPKTGDELGQLALTFNAMADKIESDVTELRRQEQLRRDLIANIAHDLVTPLTAIQGFSEALADDVISEPKARQETAQRIAREVQRLRRLASDMQNMSSLESGYTQLEMAPLNLHELVDETLAVIGPECEQEGILLRNEISPETPLVLADSDRITQVLLNLLDNARRHTPRGGSITIRSRVEGNSLTVEVCDTGEGISSDDLPYIFERFYRVDRARTGSTGGTGLGLAIVKAIIMAHGGTIYADSKLGEGTCISFTLPLASVN